MRAAADDFCEIMERNKDRCDPGRLVKWTCFAISACAIGSVFCLQLDTLYVSHLNAFFFYQNLNAFYVPMMGYEFSSLFYVQMQFSFFCFYVQILSKWTITTYEPQK